MVEAEREGGPIELRFDVFSSGNLFYFYFLAIKSRLRTNVFVSYYVLFFISCGLPVLFSSDFGISELGMDVFGLPSLQTKRYLILFLSVYITWVMGISSGAAGGFQSLLSYSFIILRL